MFGYFIAGPVTTEGSYVARSPQPLNSGRRIVLQGRTPTNVAVSPVAGLEITAYNIVVSTDRPLQPALLGLYADPQTWLHAYLTGYYWHAHQPA